MIASLRADPVYGAVLHKVRQTKEGVWLHFERSKVKVDRLVITLPPPALERVVFEPALDVGKRCAVEACGMSRAVKISWVFHEPWWRDEGWGRVHVMRRSIATDLGREPGRGTRSDGVRLRRPGNRMVAPRRPG